MSLDIYLKLKECPTCGNTKQTENFNYTYNVSCMWYAIYPDDKHMVDIDGMTAEESLPKLRYAYDELVINKEKFEELNPINGWGCYKSFKEFILDLIKLAQDYPDYIWHSCR